MTPEWAIGTSIALAVLVGGIIIRDRQVMKSITDGDKELLKSVNEGDEKVHHRINNILITHVKKDDLEMYLKPLKDNVTEMREEQRGTNQRIDTLLNAMVKE